MRRVFAGGIVAIALAACGGSANLPAGKSSTTVTRDPSVTGPPPGTGTASTPVSASSRRPWFGVGNVPGCLGGADPTGHLRQYDAGVLRIVVSPSGAALGSHGEAIPCLKAATAAGYRVHLVIQYLNPWSAQQAASYFRQVLTYYAPYTWAVSIGNEQELYQGGPAQPPEAYAADWRALEPILAQIAPRAIRVAGEISPWGWNFLKRALSAGLPGAQALAAHVYTYRYHFQIAEFADWSRSVGLPYWFTEGAYYSGSKAPVVPISQLKGAQIIETWLGY